MSFEPSSLTVALASLGGVVLAGVIAHGAWSARKAGPKRASSALPREDQREPVLDDGALPLSPADEPDPGLPVLRPSRRTSPRLDALIDALATLTLEAPLSGDMVQSHLPATRRIGSKVFMIEGHDVESGEWETPVNGQRYSEFQAGVQLANRSGALNEIEYSEFVQSVQAFADATSALADIPDMLEVMARARELDAFASQHDAQLEVRLHARAAAWSVGYIQQHGRRHGFMPGVVAGRLVHPSADEGAPPVLTLTFDSQAALADQPDVAAVRDVTLSFDVPQTDPATEPFAAWQAAAQVLAVGMDAEVVDDDGRPLSADGFVAIGSELGKLYEALAARDLSAGSPAARRLFS
ncbi:MAG: cell division protein FtsZ [Pseudomonadota bacterium]|nr:cell division protein FtsZ [Pseudomonadota bacterium]